LYPTLVNAKPTKAHYFIKLLNDKGILLRHYTQNIDGLDHLTGLPGNKIVEAHGHIKSGSCIDCKSQYTFDFIKDAVLADQLPQVF
jgi:NAD-dependent deacetylase sirtuin 2